MSEEIPEKRKFESVEEEEEVLAEKKQAIGEKDAVAPISTSIASTSISAPEEVPITVNISIPQARVPALIGKKGIVVKEIAHQSNCKIYVEQNFPEGQPRQVILTGKAKDLSLAMSLVTKIIENGPSAVFPSIPTPENLEPDATEFYIPHPKVGTVIGFRGSNVSEINRRTGCRVSIVQEGVPEGADRKVNFFGTPEQVAEAKAMVILLMEEGALPDMPGSGVSNSGGNKRPIDSGPGSSGGARSGSRFGDNGLGAAPSPYGPASAGSGGYGGGRDDRYGGGARGGNGDSYNNNSNNNPNGLLTADSDIEPDKVRTLIGSKGVTINELMDRSGCKIVVNQKFPEGQMHKVMYNGTRPQVNIAMWLVNLVRNFGITGLHNTIGKYGMVLLQEVELFQNQMLRLQAGGSSAVSLNDIQTRCSVKIDSEPLNTKSVNPDTGFLESVHKITVMGSQDNVSAALRMLSNATRSGGGGGRDDYFDSYAGNNQRGGGGGRSPQRQPQYGSAGGGASQQQQQPRIDYGSSDAYGGGGGRYGEEYNPSAAPIGSGSSSDRSGGGGNNYYGGGGGGGPHGGAGPGVGGADGNASSGGAPMLVLGEDGSSGHLEAATTLHDGLQLQVAMIRPNALPRLVGEQHANIALIKEKSGSSLQVLKGDSFNPNTTVIVIGLPQCVTLAAQMIQEVLVNGTAKLQRMAEIPMSTALVAATSAHLAAYLAKRAGSSINSGAGAGASHVGSGGGNSSYGGSSYGSASGGGGGYGGDAYGSSPRFGGHGAYGQQQQQQSYGGRR